MSSYHILLVDDDLIMSGALKAFLESEHYDVSLAEDCQRAREILQGSTRIDLMILDYLMPDGNGTELLQLISQESGVQRPPVIMSSSIVSTDNPGWMKLFNRLTPVAQSLVHAFVSKPYSFEVVDQAVRKMLKIRLGPTNSTEILSGDYIAPVPLPDSENAA